MLTIPKAAKSFEIPYPTLLRLVNEGHIPHLDIPGRRSALLDPADVQAWIDRSKSGSVSGSVDEKQPAQMAANKQSRKHVSNRRITRKSMYDEVFARKRTSCS